MLSGSARPETLGRGAPTIPDLTTGAATLEDVQTLQVLCEFSSGLAETLLPPALHPTLPGLVGFTVQRVGTSPWGPFAMAQARIECRSGVRPRGFLIGAVVDHAAAAAALSSRWGYRVRPGEVRLRRFYDQVRAEVTIDGEEVLALCLRDPEPLAAADVQYVATMNLASTPKGLRLVQVDPAFTIDVPPHEPRRGSAVARLVGADVHRRPARPAAALEVGCRGALVGAGVAARGTGLQAVVSRDPAVPGEGLLVGLPKR